MRPSRTLSFFIFNLVAGVAAFIAFYIPLSRVSDNHAAITFLLALLIYFAAGVLGFPSSPFPSALAIFLPGTVTILVLAYLGYAFTARFYIGCFFSAALIRTLCGILTRRLFASGRLSSASLIVIGLAVVSVLAVRTFIPHLVAASLSKNADLPTPAFEFSSLDGQSVTSDQLRGKVVLLAFWATWCRPCLGELPLVQHVYQRYKHDPRVVIWAVDSGISNDTVEKQRRMITASRWDLPFAHDSENLEYKMGLHGLPKLVLLDRSGRIRWLHDGFDASERLSDQIASHIELLLGPT